jgi:type IV pilus secretin PilQ/predicted competence protein
MKRIQIFTCALAFNLWLTGAAYAAQDTPVSLRLTNADINVVLRTLASMGGVSLVVDDSVTGKITLQLDEVPFQEALEIVTKSKDLAVQKIGNTLIVATPEKISKGFGTVQIVKLQYAKAEDIQKSLALIVPEAQIKVDVASNSILFSGTLHQISEVQRAAAELDKQLAQVVIEAEVIEMNKNTLKDLGLSYDFKTIPYLDPDYTIKDDGAKVYTDKTHQRLKLFSVNGEAINVGIRATLHAQIEKGEGKVLAKPRVMALNNKDAKIHIGQKIPVVQYDKDGNKSISYIEVGIKLEIMPHISDNNYNQAAEGYEISTREAETTVRLQDGETLMIGGLYNTKESKSTLKVPFLGDLPLIGNLFKSTNVGKRDTEIIVLLRPTIVTSGN